MFEIFFCQFSKYIMFNVLYTNYVLKLWNIFMEMRSKCATVFVLILCVFYFTILFIHVCSILCVFKIHCSWKQLLSTFNYTVPYTWKRWWNFTLVFLCTYFHENIPATQFVNINKQRKKYKYSILKPKQDILVIKSIKISSLSKFSTFSQTYRLLF